MRVGRPAWLAALLFAFAALPALAATTQARVLLPVPSTRGDFDRDGRADSAAGMLTNPSIVRLTLSRAGIRDIQQPAPVLAVAGFDYDSDGDLDLLVSTSDGAILWVNEGHGVFSVFPLLLPARSPMPPASAWIARATLTEVFLERHESAIAQGDRDGPRGPQVFNAAGRSSDARISDLQFSAAPPRAPPRS